MKKKQFLFLFLLVLFVFEIGIRIVNAQEEEKENSDRTLYDETAGEMADTFMAELNLEEIQNSVSDMFPEEKINFGDIVSLLVSGNLGEAGKTLTEYIRDVFTYEFRYNRHSLAYIILIAVAASAFSNFAGTFKSRQIADISFYILYMLLITFCLSSFHVVARGTEEVLDSLLSFMRALCPAYFLAVAFAAGSTTSMMFYNTVLFIIYAVELVIARFVLPVINVYIMVRVLGSLTGEDFLSELAELLRKIISWCLRAFLAGVIGINAVQSLIAPAIDSLKRGALTKTAEALPWIGNAMGSTAEMVLGTAVLIKNGVGVAGALLAVLICAVPVVQTAVLALAYKLAGAVVQPVSDKRITACISGVSEGYELLLRVIFTAALLFLLTIAVTAASTS